MPSDAPDALAHHAERAAGLIDGDALVHWDVRADNVVPTADRTVLVDWGRHGGVRRGSTMRCSRWTAR